MTSYKANANPDDEKPPKPAFGAIDGMVPDRNVPFGQALVVYPVPVSVASAAKNESK